MVATACHIALAAEREPYCRGGGAVKVAGGLGWPASEYSNGLTVRGGRVGPPGPDGLVRLKVLRRILACLWLLSLGGRTQRMASDYPHVARGRH
jgi:hypothetical protein